MVGVPVTSNIFFLIGFFSYFRDHGIVFDGFEKAVDVDLSPAICKGYVLLWREVLISEENDAVVQKDLADLGELFIELEASESEIIGLENIFS